MTYLSHLECSKCGSRQEASKPQGLCPCGGPLLARYDLAAARRALDRDAIARRPGGMWRYAELLPAGDPAHVVTLGEGGTPLVHARRLGQRLGVAQLYVKDEGGNPSGSFKARGASAAVSKLREFGLRDAVISSSGNAGSAWATYCARAGIGLRVIVPPDAVESVKRQIGMMGARLFHFAGPLHEAGALAERAAKRHGWFNVNTMREPYRVEGKKTMGLEIAEQLGWSAPDAIIYPTGGGTGVVAIWKALDELAALGWIAAKRPRLIVSQYEGCAPIVKACREGKEQCEVWAEVRILPGGLRSPKPPADFLILRTIRETGGAALAVSGDEALEAMSLLAATEGLHVCPEGATSLAALRRALADGVVRPDERVVLMNTGTGLKYPPLLPEAAVETIPPGGEIPA
jgi:threonine synthase